MSSQRGDQIERAHLHDPADTTFTIARFGPSAELAPLVQRFWLPVWSVPGSEERRQQVLQYPVALLVVSDSYARFYGVQSGLSETTLTGSGWACGVMLQPATGHLLAGGSMRRYTDRFVDLGEVLDDGEGLVRDVRAFMSPDPSDGSRQREAAAAFEARLAPMLPLCPDAQLVNAVVAAVESMPALLRVAALAEQFGLSERSLQRLTATWLGLSPKWLIQRRRLHEAAGHLREGSTDLATIAVDLGYADQAHFTRDWRRVTGMTPGQFAARFSAAGRRVSER